MRVYLEYRIREHDPHEFMEQFLSSGMPLFETPKYIHLTKLKQELIDSNSSPSHLLKICTPKSKLFVEQIGSWVQINDLTTEEQTSAIEFTNARYESIQGIGYIDPERINSYFCNICENEHKGPPAVKINVIGNDLDIEFDCVKAIGHMFFKCGECNSPLGYGFIYEGNSPDPQYIDKDFTGNFIAPTPDSIEQLLTEAEEKIHETGKLPKKLTLRAINWSRKIGYEIDSERYLNLSKKAQKRNREIMQEYFDNSIEEIYDELFNNYYQGNLTPRKGFNKDNDALEILLTGIEVLVATASQLKLPTDLKLKQQFIKIISSYQNSLIYPELQTKTNQLAELNKEIKYLEKEQKKIKVIFNKIT